MNPARSSLVLSVLFVLSACHHDREARGPFERAGGGLDRASDKTGHALSGAATTTGAAVQKAGQETGKAFVKVGDKLSGKSAGHSDAPQAAPNERKSPPE